MNDPRGFDAEALDIARKNLEQRNPQMGFLRECHDREERIIADHAAIWGAEATKRARLRLEHQRKVLRELYAVKSSLDGDPGGAWSLASEGSRQPYSERLGMADALAFQVSQMVGEYDDFPGWRERYRPPAV